MTSISTQGHISNSEWVTSYSVQYLLSDGSTWQTIMDGSSTAVLQANADQNSVVENSLPTGVTTLGIRLIPVSWNTAISLRWQLYGCYEKRELYPINVQRANSLELHLLATLVSSVFSAQLCSSSSSVFCSGSDVTVTSSEGTSLSTTICPDSTSEQLNILAMI